MIRLASVALVAVGLSLCASGIASAQEVEEGPSDVDVENARRHYEAGVSYYEALRYDDAAREFREAFRLSGRAHLLKNVATSLQHARRFSESADTYEEYLERNPDADDREGVRARIRTLRELAESEARGEHTEEHDLPDAAPLENEDGTTRPEPSTRSGGLPVVPVVLVGGGVALGVAALVVGLVAHGAYNDLDAMCTGGVCDPSLAGRRNEGETLAVVSTVLTGAAIAVGVTGVLLWLLDGGGSGETDGTDDASSARRAARTTARRPRLGAYADANGAGLVLTGAL